MSKPSLQSAVPSALGYYFQSLYALVLICEADDDATISIETDDDLFLEGDVNKLVQLKHSLANKTDLSITDTGFWKAIRNWSLRTHDGTEQFLFVTRAPIGDDSPLRPLLKPNTHRKDVVTALVTEATRVMDERKAAEKTDKKPLPHQERYKGCEAFLALNAKRQQQLVKYIQIPLDAPTAADVPKIISKKLGSMLLPNVREAIIGRLIQWWDREVVLSLLGNRSRSLSKHELQTALNRLIIEHGEESLPDDFSPLQPAAKDDGVGRFMQKQIDWVNGGTARLNRAALARWRARNQREAWMRKEIAVAQELRKYDDYLVEQWKDRFAPAKEDCKTSDEPAQCKVGLGLLDWSHLNASKDVRPIRKLWEHAYLVQGTYQQLAEQGDVGWHPDYEAKYKALKEST